MHHLPPGSSEPNVRLIQSGLRTPRAAAIAGILFSVLLIVSLWLFLNLIPADPRDPGLWLTTSSQRVSIALNLVPFAGIAFLWFLGVLRDRLGKQEDQFFATVFLGSGLMFVGMIFVAASALGGLILGHSASPRQPIDTATFTFAFARSFTYAIMHTYAFKMAAVFMITTSTLVIKTRLTPPWIAYLGYASAAFLLVGSSYLDWVLFVFPCWILLVSVYILTVNLRGPQQMTADAG